MRRNFAGWGVFFLALFSAVIFVNLFGGATYRISGFEVRFAYAVGFPGESNLTIPPVGSIKSRTHVLPVKLRATLRNIDPDLVGRMLRGEVSAESIRAELEANMGRVIISLILKVLGVAGAGGAFGAFLADRFKPKKILGGALVGLGFILVLSLATYATFDARGLENPEYTGIIDAAPWMIGLVDKSLLKVGEIQDSMKALGRNITAVLSYANSLEPLDEVGGDFTRVLVVSDIHNNLAALDFIRQVVLSFKVDFVIDTGDLTDFGSQMEVEIADHVGELGVPYVFVAGNHDTPLIKERLSQTRNVVLLGGRRVVLKGIQLAGIDDPASGDALAVVADGEEFEAYQEKLSRLVDDALSDGGPLEIVAVHNFKAASHLVGKVPLILHGHDHKVSVRESQGTVIVNPGTAGGAGLRGFLNERGVPMSVALLHFSRDGEEGQRLAAVDIIKIGDSGSGFSLERRLIRRSEETHSTLAG